MAEKKPFVFYEFLLFFWKKKVFFIIIPLIVTLIGYGSSFIILNKAKYVGQTTVFTGSIQLKAMNDPANLVSQFGDGVDGEIDAYVSSDSYIKIKVFNDDKDELTKDLNEMTDKIEAALLQSYDSRLEITEKNLKSHEDRQVQLSEAMDIYLERLNGDLTVEESLEYTELLAKTEVEMTDASTKAQRIINDLAFFEKPSVIRNDVKPANNYRTELTIAGFVLGVFMTFLILALWKYILDARRYFSHD